MDRLAKHGPRLSSRGRLLLFCLLPLALCCAALAGCSGSTHVDVQAAEPVETEDGETQGQAAEAALDDQELEELRGLGIVDESDNPTVRALLSVEDPRLVELLGQLGFAFDAERGGWLRSDSGDPCFAGVLDAEGAMGENELADGSAQAEARYYLLQPSSYDSVESALVGAAGYPLADHELVDDDTGIAVLAGPDGAERALVVASALGRGAVSLAVFGESAIAAGLLDEAVDGELGQTLDAAWLALTGRSLASSQAAS